jgi:hypothetical protein
MGWDAVWQLALKQFGAEAVEIRIAIILATAFLALMILVGLRYAFRPAGPAPVTKSTAEPTRRSAPVLATAAITPAAVEPASPFRVAKPMLRSVRKSAKRTINHQQAPRPMIRRAAAMEIDAPYSPLPPRR